MDYVIDTLRQRQVGEAGHNVRLTGPEPDKKKKPGKRTEPLHWWFEQGNRALMAALADPDNGWIVPFDSIASPISSSLLAGNGDMATRVPLHRARHRRTDMRQRVGAMDRWRVPVGGAGEEADGDDVLRKPREAAAAAGASDLSPRRWQGLGHGHPALNGSARDAIELAGAGGCRDRRRRARPAPPRRWRWRGSASPS